VFVTQLWTVTDHELRHTTVVLHVHAERSTFKLSRFNVNRNNVRRRWFSGETNQPANTGVLSGHHADNDW